MHDACQIADRPAARPAVQVDHRIGDRALRARLQHGESELDARARRGCRGSRARPPARRSRCCLRLRSPAPRSAGRPRWSPDSAGPPRRRAAVEKAAGSGSAARRAVTTAMIWSGVMRGISTMKSLGQPAPKPGKEGRPGLGTNTRQHKSATPAVLEMTRQAEPPSPRNMLQAPIAPSTLREAQGSAIRNAKRLPFSHASMKLA